MQTRLVKTQTPKPIRTPYIFFEKKNNVTNGEWKHADRIDHKKNEI